MSFISKTVREMTILGQILDHLDTKGLSPITKNTKSGKKNRDYIVKLISLLFIQTQVFKQSILDIKGMDCSHKISLKYNNCTLTNIN